MPVHCHPGRGPVQFSSDDLASHERGYPAILEITQGGPVVPVVFSKDAVAGIVWTPQGRSPVEPMTIVGPQMRNMYICQIIPLAFLAPEITEAILNGRYPAHLTLHHCHGRISLDWSQQVIHLFQF